jgi:hypothetical protein
MMLGFHAKKWSLRSSLSCVNKPTSTDIISTIDLYYMSVADKYERGHGNQMITPCENHVPGASVLLRRKTSMCSMTVFAQLIGLQKRNDLGSSASAPVSALTPLPSKSSFTFVPYKSDCGHGDHVIQSSARPSVSTALNQPGRLIELIISSPVNVSGLINPFLWANHNNQLMGRIPKSFIMNFCMPEAFGSSW